MLKPDRDLDALVSQKVMGWTVVQRIGQFRCVGIPPGKKESQDVPYYSSDMGFVWAVVDAMFVKEDLPGGIANPWLTLTQVDDHGWVADFDGVAVESATPSHAICLAALKAVGVEDA